MTTPSKAQCIEWLTKKLPQLNPEVDSLTKATIGYLRAQAPVELAEELAALDALPQVDHSRLFRFYNVTTVDELISIQSLHIQRLQSKLPPMRDEQPRNYREG